MFLPKKFNFKLFRELLLLQRKKWSEVLKDYDGKRMRQIVPLGNKRTRILYCWFLLLIYILLISKIRCRWTPDLLLLLLLIYFAMWDRLHRSGYPRKCDGKTISRLTRKNHNCSQYYKSKFCDNVFLWQRIGRGRYRGRILMTTCHDNNSDNIRDISWACRFNIIFLPIMLLLLFFCSYMFRVPQKKNRAGKKKTPNLCSTWWATDRDGQHDSVHSECKYQPSRQQHWVH